MKNIFDKLIEELSDDERFKLGPLEEAVKVKAGDVRKIQKTSDSQQQSGESGDSGGEDGEGESSGGESGEQSPGQSGGGSSGQQSGEEAEDGEGKPSEGGGAEGGEPGDEQGDEQAAGGSSAGKGEEGEGGSESDPLGDDTGEPRVPDSHDPMYKGGKAKGFKDIFKKIYKEAQERGESGSSSAGSGSGGIINKVRDFAYPPLDVDEILKNLNNFKRLRAGTEEQQGPEDTHQAPSPSMYGPGGEQSKTRLAGRAKTGSKIEPFEKSAILFFAIDTSGSISQKDFNAIKGYLKEITQRFSKAVKVKNEDKQTIGKMTGEVFLLEWDTELHKPIRRWTKIVKKGGEARVEDNVTNPQNLPDEEDAENIRGGGGTDINKALFSELDGMFLREDDETGKAKFVLDDTEDWVATDRKKFKSKEDVKNSKYVKLGKIEYPVEYSKDDEQSKKKQKKAKNKKIKRVKPEDMDLSSGNVNFTNTAQSTNIPFLIIYTDGGFPKANYKLSKLFRDNPGNILYILTQRENVDNISPKNVVFHDLERDVNKE